MTAEQTLYSVLSSAAGVTALVGTRIYPDVAPQTASLPCVAFVREATEFITVIHGQVVGQVANIAIVAMADTRASSDAVADAIVAAASAQGIYPIARRAELDPESDTWATFVNVEIRST